MSAPRCILAAVDFSDRSRVALGFAARLAATFDAGLRVMHAQDPLLTAAAERQGMNLAKDTETELAAFVAATPTASRRRCDIDVIVGKPASAIAAVAERECADLIVMAAHGMSAAEHAMLGSTTEGVLRRANVPVMVVPDAWAPPHPDADDLAGCGPVVVAVDFRIPSFAAAAEGVLLARRLGTELILAHVIPTAPVLQRWRTHAEAAHERRRADALLGLEQLRGTLGAGVAVRTEVMEGRVASCLSMAAKPYRHALLVVGRTVHPDGSAPLGRTAYRVVTEAQVPVLMHVAGRGAD